MLNTRGEHPSEAQRVEVASQLREAEGAMKRTLKRQMANSR